MNVTFGLIEDTSHSPIRDKAERRRRIVDRALARGDPRVGRDAVEAGRRAEGGAMIPG